MSYAQVRQFLQGHTHLVELNAGDARVLVAPQWQGRVMTSTGGGDSGRSFGFINRQFIEAGKLDPHVNDYGGEEGLWLAPEGGPFGLWFKPGASQDLVHWYTPAALNEGAWKVAAANETECRLETRVSLENASGASFLFDVKRTIRLVDRRRLGILYPTAGDAFRDERVPLVAYESVNELVNRGEPMTREQGLVSIWMLAMLITSSKTTAVVPYTPGTGGLAIKAGVFGGVAPTWTSLLPKAVLFRADAKHRTRVRVGPARARDRLGSIDLATGALTAVQFSVPDDPCAALYLNNGWGEQADPFHGDVALAYNDGPHELGNPAGTYVGIETFSPAAALRCDESLSFMRRTLHLQAEPPALETIARSIFGLSLQAMERAFSEGQHA